MHEFTQLQLQGVRMCPSLIIRPIKQPTCDGGNPVVFSIRSAHVDSWVYLSTTSVAGDSAGAVDSAGTVDSCGSQGRRGHVDIVGLGFQCEGVGYVHLDTTVFLPYTVIKKNIRPIYLSVTT